MFLLALPQMRGMFCVMQRVLYVIAGQKRRRECAGLWTAFLSERTQADLCKNRFKLLINNDLRVKKAGAQKEPLEKTNPRTQE
jgi:hypothetical protein